MEYLQDRDGNVRKGASEDLADNTRTPNKMSKPGVLWMVGAKNIKDIILKDKLIFLHSILRLPDHAAPKQILLARHRPLDPGLTLCNITWMRSTYLTFPHL